MYLARPTTQLPHSPTLPSYAATPSYLSTPSIFKGFSLIFALVVAIVARRKSC